MCKLAVLHGEVPVGSPVVPVSENSIAIDRYVQALLAIDKNAVDIVLLHKRAARHGLPLQVVYPDAVVFAGGDVGLVIPKGNVRDAFV